MIVPQTWWTGGVAPAERPARPPAPADAAGPAVRAGTKRPSAAPKPSAQSASQARTPAALADPTGKPAWAATVEQALARTPPDPPPPADGSWSAGFAAVLAPFTRTAADRVPWDCAPHGAEGTTDAEALRECFTEQVSRLLVRLARRTLVLELNVARERGQLSGDTPQARFRDFVRQTSARRGLSALVAEYPVLARLLAQACDQAAAAWAEVLERLAEDRAELVARIMAGVDPGRLVRMDTGAGDRHRGGRAVAVLTFDSGARVVYKPRPLTVHRHFNDAVSWFDSRLGGLGLRRLTVLARPHHGWVEYAAAAPCEDAADVDRFYRRLGALLALVHALGATDLHFENLIACADQPVLVDLETLFHPDLRRPAGGDPAQAALAASVVRTALLPVFLVGEHGVLDVSGLGGDRDRPLPDEVTGWSEPGTDTMRLVRTVGTFRGADNRPRLRAEETDSTAAPTDAAAHRTGPAADGTDAAADTAADRTDAVLHVDALVAGFRAGYDVIVRHRGELTGPGGLLARFAEDVTRVVLRPTRWYTTLLDESTHPDLLRDARDRDRLLDDMCRDPAGGAPASSALVAAELAELWAGDVPLAAGAPGSTDLTIGPADGRAVTDGGLVAEAGLARAERRIAAMGDTDRFDQEWVIRATLATRRHAGGARAAGAPSGGPAATMPDAERLLAAACGVADRILARAQDDGRRVNWLCLEPLDDRIRTDRIWAVQPQGAGLPHGYCGTALFLAQLADLTGTERYAAVARRALAPLPGLLAALAARPADLPDIGAGFAGLGGIAYALQRLAGLLHDPEVARWAEAAVDLAAAAAGVDPEPGVLDGDAGCLAAMLTVQQATGSATAGATARACADRLAARAPRSLPAGGLGAGAAGVGWALLRFAAAGGGPAYASAGLAALDAAAARCTAPAGTGWCDELQGVALATADSPAAAGVPELARLLDRAVERAAAPTAGNHSLGAGAAGALDLLLVATRAGHADPGVSHPPASALLAALDRFGPRCATPDSVSSPGLLTGLAGIGYELLRLGFGSRVPSVLLLRSPAS